jgi:hypothetical protein
MPIDNGERWKSKCEQAGKECKSHCLMPMLGLTALLFAAVLLFCLFGNQPWLEHILQVIIGVLLGVGITSISISISIRNQVNSGSVNISDAIVHGIVAGRDIIENIQKVEKHFQEIRDSVIKINQIPDCSSSVDILFFGLPTGKWLQKNEWFEKELLPSVKSSNGDGWRFQQLYSRGRESRDYIFAIFVRPTPQNETPKIVFGGDCDDLPLNELPIYL